MGSGGGGGGGNTVQTIRYAPYLEEAHSKFIDDTVKLSPKVRANNPYEEFTKTPVDIAFFGEGYSLYSFPSLYDMYGKFMAGMDIEALWTQMYNSSVYSPLVEQMTTAFNRKTIDDMETTTLPRYQTGMRDIGSVLSSTYVIGKGLLEDSRVRQVSAFEADLRYKFLPIAQERWREHLRWNTQVIDSFINIINSYYTTKVNMTNLDYTIEAKKNIWEFTVLDYVRANVGTLAGAAKTTTGTESDGMSDTRKFIGGALGGASAGAMIGGPWGAAAGAVIGGLASIF